MKGILGRKMGMTQVFLETGELVPVTVIDVEANVVLQKKTVENDGYQAIQLGYVDVKESRATKAEQGHAKKANSGPKRFVREIRGAAMDEFEVGSSVTCEIFKSGDMVDITGISKGKGYAGVVKRHGFRIGPKAHGSGYHRGVGSLATGGRTIARIYKGRKMPGHMGVKRVTNQNLEIIKVDAENNYMLVKGNVPGPKRGLVVIKTTVKRIKEKEAVKLVEVSAKGE